MLDLWGQEGFIVFFRESRREQRARRKEGHATSRPVPVCETSPKLTVIRVPDHGVFVVPIVLEELHDPVADLLYLAEVRLYGNSRYNVGAAVGLGLTQPLVTRVI